ncbi:hypothetical protein [Roseovarius indicus]|uniref:Uncharacterized protein n=1 Tax=Roseovarius indicus TaxID=540747 RepID=A0A0T5P3B1_9RHOB|nr:hypothetical protein [Roseovarius indicus]KRS15661.1 hypothetical protein XM52_22750 [Roseovarius indicus]QEW27828.1 hypothetical protein RIdsm_03648 [Roseovarius indicus]SFE79737.1 hypothetical protein SAMN04488031_12240 [Roseovarius indicus]
MTQSRPLQNAFSSAELDPLLRERTDFQRFQTGLEKSIGFLPLRQGAFTRAPGTIFRGTTKDNKKARRLPFQFARNDSLSLEFTDELMRVWRYGQLVMDGASPFELAVPFQEADLGALEWVQDADLTYIADGQRPVQKLSRLALDDWEIGATEFVNGPFRNQNLDKDVTVQVTATGAADEINVDDEVTIAANADIFTADDVGSLFLVKPLDFKDVPVWVGQKSTAANKFFRYDDKIYESVAGASTGLTPPTHTEGTQAYGVDGIEWAFRSTDTGILRIDSVTDARNITGTVTLAIPKPCTDDPTYRWARGAWSQRFGYPSRLALHRRRMFLANTPSEPRLLWGSTIGLLTDFEPSDLPDGALGYEISGDRSRNEISWLKAGLRGIYIGGAGEVYIAFSNDSTKGLGPTTFDTNLASSDGAAPTEPIVPYGFVIFISADKTRLFEIRYDFQSDRQKPVELSLPSQHLGAATFEQIVWQSVPERHGWIRRSDGTLACLAYDPEQDVLGMAPVPLAGGFVEDMDVTVSADGTYDVVTLIVRREIDGETVRYVEELANNRPAMLGAVPATHFNHAYASAVFEPDPADDTFFVPHLIGQAVYAWTDKGQFGPLTVQPGGYVYLPDSVSRAVIGLVDGTHRARTLPLQAQGRNGDTRGRLRRLEGETGLGLHKTAGGTVRSIEKVWGQAEQIGSYQDIFGESFLSDEVKAETGLRRIDVSTGHADEVALEFIPDGLKPMTVTAIIPNMDEAGP